MKWVAKRYATPNAVQIQARNAVTPPAIAAIRVYFAIVIAGEVPRLTCSNASPE